MYISELEKEYGLKFKQFKVGSHMYKRNLSLWNTNYVYMELEDGGIIVVGSMLMNLSYNTFTSISFFYGVTVDDLPL